MAWIVREARQEDAAAMVRYAVSLFAESGLDLPVAAGEFQLTTAEEQAVVAEYARTPNAVFLLALSPEGEICGMLNCHGSSRQALRHSCEMGISVHKTFRGRGVGRTLMQAMVAWAGTNGIRRVELRVYARNERAIRLYRSFGFQAEGRGRQAVYQEGAYLDDIIMSLLL